MLDFIVIKIFKANFFFLSFLTTTLGSPKYYFTTQFIQQILFSFFL